MQHSILKLTAWDQTLSLSKERLYWKLNCGYIHGLVHRQPIMDEFKSEYLLARYIYDVIIYLCVYALNYTNLIPCMVKVIWNLTTNWSIGGRCLEVFSSYIVHEDVISTPLWSGASAPRGWTDLPMGKLVVFNIYLTLRMDAHGISTYYSAQEANHKLSTYCTHVVPVSWKVG